MVSWNGNIAKITVPTPFAVGDVNVYLIKGETLTLIDAGVKTKEAWELFTFQLSQLGYIPEDIEQVVLTHHHPDHVGFLEWLSDDIWIYGHPYCVPWLEKDESFFASHDQFYYELFKEFGIEGDFQDSIKKWKSPLKYGAYRPITETIKERDTIPGLENWFVLETPGHAQSHLSFYRENDRTLIAGDHVLATISSNPLLEPPLKAEEERPRPQLQYNASLKKLLNYDIHLTYTGHGADVSKVHSLIERRIQRQHDRAMQVKAMLKEKPLSTFEICKKLFPAVYQKELGLTLSETTAQLDYLLSLGEINKSMDANGVAYFFAN
ncbi:MBL fold metallo-hydrolase [Bacillus sp. FJAT-49736]|uniref:MBL fold metallo-hydrolase n=1 Tax=Bacillus sp. FJAT-49736 TaxID=2833582 RepID=UPI001BCA1C9F|nr:MBL fold metallo-hydrolase [Bacillus sp. FJAT-49736]MBS4173383.1 MBL fold metallo-hydrolase [Bacillus sp. FJAT-49736]